MSLIIVEDNINHGVTVTGTEETLEYRGYVPTQGCSACISWRTTQSDDTMLGPIQQYAETFSLIIEFDPNNLPEVGDTITINNNTYKFVGGTPQTNLEVDVTVDALDIINQFIEYWQKDPTIYNFFIVGLIYPQLFLQTQNYGSKYIPTYESGSDNVLMYPQTSPTDRQGEDLVLRPDYFVEVEAVVNKDDENPIIRVIQPIIRYGISTPYHDPLNTSYIHYAELTYDFNTLFKDLVTASPPEATDPVVMYLPEQSAVVDVVIREKQADGQSSNSVDDESLNPSFKPLSDIHIIHSVCEEDEDNPLDMSPYFGLYQLATGNDIKFLNVAKTADVLELCPNSLQYVYISVPLTLDPVLIINTSLGGTLIEMPDPTGSEKASEIVRVQWSDPNNFNYPLNEEIEIYVRYDGFFTSVISEVFTVKFVDKFECCCLQEFLFSTKRGAYETLQASCVFEEAYKIEAEEYFPCYSCLNDSAELQIYRPTYEIAETLRSISLPNTEATRTFIEAFVSSTEIYKVTYDDGGNMQKNQVYLTVFPELYANHKNQIQFEFSYTYSNTFTGIRNL